MRFSEDELKRYHRQMLIDGWGKEGQAKLKNSTMFIAGAGGLGSPVAICLAVSGIGHIKICDFDNLDVTNLNRQILHNHTRIGTNKAISGKGATPGVIGTLQALEIIKYLTGISTNIKGELLILDRSKMECRIFKASKDPDCTTCGDK